MSVQASFYSYLQNLKNICACKIAENDLFADDFTDFPPSEEIFTAFSDISANPKTSDPQPQPLLLAIPFQPTPWKKSIS